MNIKSGNTCEIISYSLQYPSFLFPGKTQKVNDPRKNHFQISSLINSINPISWYKVSQYILSKKPDYVILRYWNPFFAPCLGFIASKLKRNKIPAIAWVDNINPHDSFIFQNKLTKYFLNKVNSALVMSSSVKNDLLKLYPNFKVIYSPHPIYNNFGPIVSKQNARKNWKCTSLAAKRLENK